MRNNVTYLRRAMAGPVVVEETVGACLDRAARQYADQEALVVSHQRLWWTYRQLRVRVESLAIGLLGLGLAPGDRIGIWSANCAESVLAQFAAAKSGLILVNIDPGYGRVELEYVLNKAGCRALILAPSSKSSNHIDILRAVAPEIDRCVPGKLEATRVPELKVVILLGTGSSRGMLRFDDLVALRTPMEKQALFAVGAIVRPTDPIAIRFTSGSVGAPKRNNTDSSRRAERRFLRGRGDQAQRIHRELVERGVVKAALRVRVNSLTERKSTDGHPAAVQSPRLFTMEPGDTTVSRPVSAQRARKLQSTETVVAADRDSRDDRLWRLWRQ